MFTRSQCETGAHYVLNYARQFVESFGPRPPGSGGEQRVQEWVREELAETCDEPPLMEPFLVAPKAFMGQQRVSAGIMAAAVIAFCFYPPLAAALSALAVFVVYAQLIRYWRFLDPFFSKRTSYNVYAARKPSGPVRRRIVLNGHPDAAFEWRLHYHYPGKLPLFALGSLLSLVLALIFHAGGAALWYFAPLRFEPIWLALCLAQIVLLPGIFAGFAWANFRVVSPGANDNLTGTLIATGIARMFDDNGLRLANTEVGFLITGSEEAGLRGAKAFASLHAKEFADVETVFVALDTFRDTDHMAVYNRDLNGTVRHDAAVCKLLKDSAEACGYTLPYATVTLGSTDATAFTQAGLRAGALCAMDPAPAPFYHTRRDSPDNMSRECVEQALVILAETLRRFDQDGLAENPKD